MPRAPLPNPRKVLGRRKRETILTDLPDDVLIKIIHHSLQMNPRLPGEVSRRVRARFQTLGVVIAQLSRRFYALMRQTVTSLQLTSRPPHSWLQAMLVFAQASLTSLHLKVDDEDLFRSVHPSPLHASRLCLMLATTRPPLRVLTISALTSAPFEHVVSMLRALPTLREIDISAPRPLDIAAIAHACPVLHALSLGRTETLCEVDEVRRQFVCLLRGPTGRHLTTLNIPWSCASHDAFDAIKRHCTRLERLAVEFGAIHWIRHYIFHASGQKHRPLHINYKEYFREQRSLFRSMLSAVSDGRLRSFALRTRDVIPADDLETIFKGLVGLTELDLFVGSTNGLKLCAQETFDKLAETLSKSLCRINIVGLHFSARQVERFSTEFPNLQTLSVWMGRNERPSVDVFSALGHRIRHLSLLCDWDEDMCAAVGRHNTKLESLFLVTTGLPMESISALVTGVRFTLNEFRLFFNRKKERETETVPHAAPNREEEVADRRLTHLMVHDTARLVAKGCAANLEVLNVSAVPRIGDGVVDCSTIASELRRSAPHLYQICDGVILD